MNSQECHQCPCPWTRRDPAGRRWTHQPNRLSARRLRWPVAEPVLDDHLKCASTHWSSPCVPCPQKVDACCQLHQVSTWRCGMQLEAWHVSIDHSPPHRSHMAAVEDTLVAGDPVARAHGQENLSVVLITHPEEVFVLIKEPLVAGELILDPMSFILIKLTVWNGDKWPWASLVSPAATLKTGLRSMEQCGEEFTQLLKCQGRQLNVSPKPSRPKDCRRWGTGQS